MRLFEAPKRPVIVAGLLDDWAASSAWQPAQLLRRFSDHRFKVGSDDEGYPVRMKLKQYLLYLLHPEHSWDDSPLYVFDGTFSGKKYAPELKKVRLRFMCSSEVCTVAAHCSAVPAARLLH